MNRFTVPDGSSSPPNATPRRPLFSDISHLSTTPAGPPPPSSAASFTPAEPPPSSVYGSSRLGTGTGVRKFQLSNAYNPHTRSPEAVVPASKAFPPRSKNGIPTMPFSNNTIFSMRSAATHKDVTTHIGEDGDQHETVAHSSEGEDEVPPVDSAFRGFTSASHGFLDRPTQNPLFKPSMGGHSYPHARHSARKKLLIPKPSQLPRKGREDLIPGIVREMTSHLPVATLNEPDEMIIGSEETMQTFSERVSKVSSETEVFQRTSTCALDLVGLWRQFVRPEASSISTNGIGPPDTALGFEKANYIASLLLVLHHQPLLSESNLSQKSTSKGLALAHISENKPIPVPHILLDWLDNYHVSYDALFESVLATSPNCTAHDYFWDAVLSLTLRGKCRQVMRLFAEADFKYAVTAKDDGADQAGYHGAQLQTVHSTINRARQFLDGCPGTRDGDWQVDNADWDIYRKRVMAEIEHLTELADDVEEEEDDDDDAFRVHNFGIRKPVGGLLDNSNRHRNAIPWTVYQSLKVMYSILLGSAEEIIAQSQDWLEASTSLTIWWDGSGDDRVATWTLNVSRSDHMERGADVDPYLTRLSAAFLCVTDPNDADSFQINTMSPIEVGLGAVLQGNSDGALRILRAQSLSITSVVAELGTFSGWLTAPKNPNPEGLDEEDLMVLTYVAPNSSVSQDEVLLAYAKALFDRHEFRSLTGKVVEGWELALSITARLDDEELTQNTTAQFLDQLDLDSQQRMDKLVALCSALGLEEEARKVCEKFADHLVNNTTNYGTALLCYARSHSISKLRQVMDLLGSYCLVQSTAYPQEDDMDENLQALVTSPKTALFSLADVDPAAAEMLQFYLVGYACIRRFYNLRDEEISATKAGRKPLNRPLSRKRQAAQALMAAINSAADSIYGGLYDPERQSAIQVDGLLTLLGEATAFLTGSNTRGVFSTTQMYALLAAIEDLQTVNSRVYDATEDCLQAALRTYHGSLPPSPHAMLKKSVSSGTNSNFSFSMMGSEILARSEESGGGKSVGSTVLVGDPGRGKIERGWDWRSQFKDKGSTGADVLRFLRVGIAKELSLAELEGGQ